jgi:hypothetical protein
MNYFETIIKIKIKLKIIKIKLLIYFIGFIKRLFLSSLIYLICIICIV